MLFNKYEHDSRRKRQSSAGQVSFAESITRKMNTNLIIMLLSGFFGVVCVTIARKQFDKLLWSLLLFVAGCFFGITMHEVFEVMK